MFPWRAVMIIHPNIIHLTSPLVRVKKFVASTNRCRQATTGDEAHALVCAAATGRESLSLPRRSSQHLVTICCQSIHIAKNKCPPLSKEWACRVSHTATSLFLGLGWDTWLYCYFCAYLSASKTVNILIHTIPSLKNDVKRLCCVG